MSQSRVDTSLVTEDGVRRVLSFLAPLSGSGAKHGEVLKSQIDEHAFPIPVILLSKTAYEFVQPCYDENFVQPFDWMEWSKKHEVELSSEAFTSRADLGRIIRLLTTHIRADRFCSGHLLSVIDDGTIVRILTRLKQLSSEQSPPA